MKQSKRIMSVLLVLTMILTLFTASLNASADTAVALRGDVRPDGSINIYDATFLQRSLAHFPGSATNPLYNYDDPSDPSYLTMTASYGQKVPSDTQRRIANVFWCLPNGKQTALTDAINIMDVTYIQRSVANFSNVAYLGIGSPLEEPVTKDTATIYVTNDPNWDEMYVDAYDATGASIATVKMSKRSSSGGKDIYTAEVPKDAAKLVFSNGTEDGSANQSVDVLPAAGGFKDGNSWNLIADSGRPWRVTPIDTPVSDTATVNTYDFDGKLKESRTFKVGDRFKVYTVLDVSGASSDGRINAITGVQSFDTDMLALASEVDPSDGTVVDTASMFPILNSPSLVVNGRISGEINYNISATKSAFTFNNTSCRLIVSEYEVLDGGTCDIINTIESMSEANASGLTRIVARGKAVDSSKKIVCYATFTEPGTVVTPTTPAPTQAPTQRPTQYPTSTAGAAVVTLYDVNGRATDTKEFKVGDTFRVYSTMNVSGATAYGKINAITAVQSFDSAVVSLTDQVDTDGSVTDTAKMFPVLDNLSLVANTGVAGEINYNTSATKSAFTFNQDGSQLIVTDYRVIASGSCSIRNTIVSMSEANASAITRIIVGGKPVDASKVIVANAYFG